MDDPTYYNKSEKSNNNKENSLIIISYYNKLENKNITENSTYYNKQKTYFVKSFVFPNDVKVHEVFALLKEMAHREGTSQSQLFLKALIEYVNRHCVPNPQVTLDRVLNTGLPAKPHDACCVPGCNRKAAYQLILQDYEGEREIFRVCQHHKEWRHSRFRFIVGFKEMV